MTELSHPILSGRDIIQIRQIVIHWGTTHFKTFPWRNLGNPWHGLVAEILLQRTRASNVIDVYQNFVSTYPTPVSLAESSIADIEDAVHSLGLAEQRAKVLKQLGEKLAGLHGVPQTREELLDLPGVGDYVASAWLSFYGGSRAVIIDVNVVRWICRLIDQPMNGETRRKGWMRELANMLTPSEDWKTYNYAVLDFTMEICAKKPQCHVCPINSHNLCLYGALHKGP